jgi:hypothetical protein
LPETPLAPWRNAAIGIPLIVLALGLAVLYTWSLRPTRFTASLLFCAVLVDLGSFGWFCEWRYANITPAEFELISDLQKYRAELIAKNQRLVPLMVGPRDSAPPNRSRLWGIPSALGYSPLLLSRYGELLDIYPFGFLSFQALGSVNQSLDILAVRYVLAPRIWIENASAAGSYLRGSARWSHVEDFYQTAVFENHRTLPRAWLVPRAAQFDSRQVLAAIQKSILPDGTVYRPRRLALVEEPVDFKPEPFDEQATVTLTHLSDTQSEVSTSARTPVFLVLSDIFYPGWRATINNEPTHIFRTNYVLRGVIVPAGSNRVRFEFSPATLYLGAAVSVCCVLLLIGLVAVAKSSRTM